MASVDKDVTAASTEGALHGSIRWEVDKDSITTNEIYSPPIEVGGMPWRVWARKCDNFGVTNLLPSLCLVYGDYMVRSVDVVAEIKLINHEDAANTVHMKRQLVFKTNSNMGIFIPWNDAIDKDNGFLKDNKFTVELDFWLSDIVGFRTLRRINFTDPKEPSHDIAIVIDGKKIYVNKGFLSMHSLILQKMFFEFAEKDKEEIELKDIQYKEFIELLHVITPPYKPISAENFEFLLKLGDRFEIDMVVTFCEQFLITALRLNLPQKLVLAGKYRLFELQDHCLGKLKTAKDVTDLKKSEESKNFSDAINVALLAFQTNQPTMYSADEDADGPWTESALRGTIHWEVDKDSITTNLIYSPPIEVGGMKWRISVSKYYDYGEPNLYHSLCLVDGDHKVRSVYVSTDFKLLNPDKKHPIYGIRKKSSASFKSNDSVGVLFAWKDVINKHNGFINDNKITVEVEFFLSDIVGFRKLRRVDFTDSNEPCHDISFVIEGKKIYTNKALISMNSIVFHKMLYDEFAGKGKNEIELKDVNYKEFIELLNMITPPFKKLTAENFEVLLNLGHRFDFEMIVSYCEQFLIKSLHLSVAQKLLFAGQYRLFDLLDYCLGELKTVKDVTDLKNSDESKNFSEDINLALLEKITKLSP